MKNKKGFTLIEILIVLVILVTVTTGATIGIKEVQKKSEQRSLRELYTMIETAADTYLSINDENREELLNDEITEKCIRIYTLQNGGLLKEELSNPVTKKRIPGNLCVISYINEEGLIENHFDLDDDLTTHKVTLKINGDGIADAETKTVYTKAIFNVSATSDKFIVNDGTCDGGATLKIDKFKVIVYGVKKDQTCTINIKNLKNTVKVNVVNGVSSPESVIVDYGKDASFTLTGNTGYHYDNYVCTGANDSSYSNNKLMVKNVTDPVTCTVTYSINKYNITINGVNGTASPSNVTADYGSKITINLTPKAGYQVNGATTNCTGGVIDATKNELVISNIKKEQQCSVTFYPITYKITLNNQSATSSGTTEVYYQYNTTKTINNVKCYYYTDSTLKTCITSGTTITKPSRTGHTFSGYYTAQNAGGIQYVNNNGVFINNAYKTAGDKTLYANWTINSYKVTLTVTNGAGSTSKNINYNSSGTFTGVKPNTGYTSAGATVSCNGGATVSLSGTTVTVSKVTKAQTCTVKFPVDKYTVTIKVTNGTTTSSSVKLNAGKDGSFTATPNANMALKSYSCTNHTVTYGGNNKFTITKLSSNTTCTITYTAVTKSFAYKSSAQTYTIPYTGYYDITAYGAQGAGSGGKGGKIIGRVKLTKGDVITVVTGGTDGTNGGGAGLYKGGGSTIIKKGNANLIIAAGGGGGSAGTAGGNGNGAGGAAASTGASGTNGGPGTKGTNGGGGGSGYDYSYSCRCSSCYYGSNTCVGGYVTTSCAQYKERTVRCPNSSCHTACYGDGVKDIYYCEIYTNQCAKWNSYYDSCKSGSNTCSYGCDDCSKSYKSGNGGKSAVGSGVTAVENTAGANTSNGKASLTYYKENL